MFQYFEASTNQFSNVSSKDRVKSLMTEINISLSNTHYLDHL